MPTVYLIQSGEVGPVKIGLTSGDPRKRIAQLQTGNPIPLRLRATMAGDVTVERHLHSKLGRFHISGEWFEPDAAIFEAFEAAKQWPNEPATLPPVTASGIKFLRDTLAICTVRETYPDGSRHKHIDWDELHGECERAAAAYDAWAAAQ